MSADNWGDCPRCRCVALRDGTAFEGGTFREDYEQGLIGNDIGYHGKCETCGFTFKFSHKERVFSCPCPVKP